MLCFTVLCDQIPDSKEGQGNQLPLYSKIKDALLFFKYFMPLGVQDPELKIKFNDSPPCRR